MGKKRHNAIRGPKSRYVNGLCLRPWVAVMGGGGEAMADGSGACVCTHIFIYIDVSAVAPGCVCNAAKVRDNREKAHGG